jgi:hypothetical protein
MNIIFTEFSRTVDSTIRDSSLRSKILAAAIGQGASYLSAIPSTEVESPANHFNSIILPEVRTTISLFNENTVFDCKAAVEFARAFWMIRYTAAHPTSRPCYTLSYSFFDSVSSVEVFVSPEQYNFLNENKEEILILASSAMDAIIALRG